MSSFWIILFHTYVSKLKTKSFIITTLVTAILLIGLSNMTNIIEYFNKDNGEEKVAVMDETGELFSLFEAQLKVVNEELIIEEFKGSQEEAEVQVENGQLSGCVAP